MLKNRRKPKPDHPSSGEGDEYLQWTLNSVSLTDDDADAVAELARSEVGAEPFYELERFRSTFTFPIRLADTTEESRGEIQRVMRRITAEVLIHNEPAFERVEQIMFMRRGDTAGGATEADPRG